MAFVSKDAVCADAMHGAATSAITKQIIRWVLLVMHVVSDVLQWAICDQIANKRNVDYIKLFWCRCRRTALLSQKMRASDDFCTEIQIARGRQRAQS